MSDVLQRVDVVVELRDARVPLSTTHPSLPSWVGSRGHVLAINRIDAVPDRALKTWATALREAEAAAAAKLAAAELEAKKEAELEAALREAVEAEAQVAMLAEDCF